MFCLHRKLLFTSSWEARFTAAPAYWLLYPLHQAARRRDQLSNTLVLQPEASDGRRRTTAVSSFDRSASRKTVPEGHLHSSFAGDNVQHRSRLLRALAHFQ